MRILTFSNCPLVKSQGSGYVITTYSEGLEARGHAVEKWGPESCEPFQFLRKGRSHRLAIGIAARALWRILWNDFDVVEFYGGECWLATILLSRWPNRRFLVVHHSNGLEPLSCERSMAYLGSINLEGQPDRWYQRLFRAPFERAYTDADGLVTVSQGEEQYALARGFQPQGRLMGIDNALPDEFLGIPLDLDREKRITFCGSWLVNKGSAVIVSDMTRALQEFPEWRLRLVGVGNDFALRDHFPAAILDRIEVIAFVSEKSRLRELYEESAIFIAPSVYESFGLVVAEAMACGCAVVTTDTGFAAALRSGVELLRMEHPRTPHLYECVRALILDDSLRRSLARTGRLRVQDLNWRVSIDALESTYSKWLNDFRQRMGATDPRNE